jgi:hypothetical protein
MDDDGGELASIELIEELARAVFRWRLPSGIVHQKVCDPHLGGRF